MLNAVSESASNEKHFFIFQLLEVSELTILTILLPWYATLVTPTSCTLHSTNLRCISSPAKVRKFDSLLIVRGIYLMGLLFPCALPCAKPAGPDFLFAFNYPHPPGTNHMFQLIHPLMGQRSCYTYRIILLLVLFRGHCRTIFQNV